MGRCSRRVVCHSKEDIMRPKEFQFNNETYEYFGTINSPRTIEIPIAWREVSKHPVDKVLEVGYVLSMWYDTHFEVIDKYEKRSNDSNLKNIDIVDFSPDKKYDLVVCISTLEHIGEGAREGNIKDKPFQAVETMKNLLSDDGLLLVTFPVGWSRFLEQRWVRFGFAKTFFMKRISEDNEWVETNCGDALKQEWGKPFPCANALIVGYYSLLGKI